MHAPPALVFDTSAPYRLGRTTRALSRAGVTFDVVEDGNLARVLFAAADPRWLVRAGAWPSASPRMPPASDTGKSLVAFGATTGDRAWEAFAADTGNDFSRAARLPRALSADSVLVEDTRGLAQLIETNGVEAALRSLFTDAAHRRVRVPWLDVHYDAGMRIVLAVTTLHRGGAERVVLDLHRELRALGRYVTLAVLDRAIRATFDAPEGTLFLHDGRRTRGERIAALAERCVAGGADVVHVHLADGDEMRVLRESGVPVVTTVHNASPGWPAGLADVGGDGPALAVACSLGVERELLQANVAARVRTVWNGIASFEKSSRADARASLGLSEQTLAVLAVANHRPQKRLDRMPAVLAALRSRGHDARLLLLGEPVRAHADALEVATRVKTMADAHGVRDALVFLGSRPDTRPLYAAADVVLSTSAFEGLSLVHLEALAAGVPLVTTDVFGTEELAHRHEGVHRVPRDADASVVADAVLRATTSAPPAKVAPDFTAKKMAERYAELFTCVGRRPTAAGRGLLLVTNNFSTGGAQSSARRLLLTLARAGIAVRAVVLEEHAEQVTPGRRALSDAGIDVAVAPRAGTVDPIVTARAVAEMVQRVNPSAVLLWNVIPEHKLLIADMLLDVPVWDVSPGEMYFASFDRYFQKPRVGAPYLSTRDYGRRLAGAVVKYPAERARAEHALGIDVHVVPNGVDVPAHVPQRRDQGPVVIGTLARINPDKKLEELIDAARHAFAAGAAFELRIAGAPELGFEPYAEALKERSADLPVRWVGEKDAAAFLAELDLFAMISEPSGCPNASLEAMAAGLPVVATDVGGAAIQIIHEKTGLVVPRADTVAFGRAIAALVRDPKRRLAMGHASHERARTHFDARRMALDYARLCLRGPDLELAEERLGAQLPHDANRFEEDLAAHLRAPERAVDERDGHFVDAHSLLDRAERHLDLERVPVGVDRRDVDGLEGAP